MGLNIEQLQNPTRAVTINNESTITELSEALVGLALVQFTGTKYLPNIMLLLKHTKCYDHMEASDSMTALT